jgi:hypothetical protein
MTSLFRLILICAYITITYGWRVSPPTSLIQRATSTKATSYKSMVQTRRHDFTKFHATSVEDVSVITPQSSDFSDSLWGKAKRQANIVYRFSRPHTIKVGHPYY